MKIYTSYFGKHKTEKENTVYCSIAVGTPRYKLPYKLKHLRELKPFGVFKVYTGTDYRIHYFEKLNKIGVETIREAFKKVLEDKENLILLCYEKDKNKCHRTMFAEWWYDKTGEFIDEYKDSNDYIQRTMPFFV